MFTEEAAKMESDLVNLIDCSTWQNISEFIGMSSTKIIDECMKTFDQEDEPVATPKVNYVRLLI